MANSQSALKRVRQNATRASRNKTLTSRMKTLRKNTLAAAEAGDKGLLQALPRCSLLSGVVGGAAPRPSVVSWRQEP